MKHFNTSIHLSRREMMLGVSGVAAAATIIPLADGEDRPEVAHPRATSGDAAVEPAWDQRLTLRAGSGGADLTGFTDRTIQAAVDYVARLGGGTVELTPGTFLLRNAVYLPSKVRIVGAGEATVLTKEACIETKLAADSDWYDQEITLEDASGFEVGDGICLQTKDPHNGGLDVLRRTLVARSGNRFKLDRALRENYWMDGNPTVSTLFPLLTAENAQDIIIEDLALDGNRANNPNLNGNYAGCVWMQDCSRIAIRGVVARNYNGDGISWQICHDVLIERCRSHGHTGLGLHPGSGAQRSVIRENVIEDNEIGIFFCWGVKYGLAAKNTLRRNATGVSIGHRDDENVVLDNDILDSGTVGVAFRPERGAGFTAKGNRVERNRIVNSGGEDGVAVDIQGVTGGNLIAANELRETRGAARRIGVRIGPDAGENELRDNVIEGFSAAIQDLRKQ